VHDDRALFTTLPSPHAVHASLPSFEYQSAGHTRQMLATMTVGEMVGRVAGAIVLGATLGKSVGALLGLKLGDALGETLGLNVSMLGETLDKSDGAADGAGQATHPSGPSLPEQIAHAASNQPSGQL